MACLRVDGSSAALIPPLTWSRTSRVVDNPLRYTVFLITFWLLLISGCLRGNGLSREICLD